MILPAPVSKFGLQKKIVAGADASAIGGSQSFADSGLGGDRTGPGSILRFLRKKALMTQSAPPAPLARPVLRA